MKKNQEKSVEMPLRDVDKVLVEKYAADFSIPREVAEIISRRYPEYGEARKYLFPDVSQLHDPGLLPDIAAAAEEIITTVKNGEDILIYTHDDVDGYTSAAIMYKALSDITKGGAAVHVYPIVREQDGYILNSRVLASYRDKGVRLLLTVDFGISNEENFRIAEQEGLKAVICDHHETKLTDFPFAAVNPKRLDSRYPFRDLAGVGVAFKLAQFLYQKFFGISASEFYNFKKAFYPIVCLGTFADRVALYDENRVFCIHGLRLINRIEDAWAVCLREHGEIDMSRILKEVLSTIGSAAYRDPQLGVDFFIEGDLDKVRECYHTLKETDQKRRQEIDNLFSEVISSAEISSKLVISLIPLSKQHYLGSVAARLRDYFKRNSLIIGIKDEKCIGELRSCDFDLYRLLYTMRKFFLDFGGHKKAAGFSMAKKHLESFLTEFKLYIEHRDPDIIEECNFTEHRPEAFLRKSDIGMLKALAPFGEGNPAPVLTDGLSNFSVDNSLNPIEIG
ncbi:MAG: DHH family phosphoesterase [candidate division WOR-3 bacterium]|nr:MAG: DHH family phosphoesterase [candidate division WOR-3 bacterium]